MTDGERAERETAILKKYRLKRTHKGTLVNEWLQPRKKGDPPTRKKAEDKKLITSAYSFALKDPLPPALHKLKLDYGNGCKPVVELGPGATYADLIAMGQVAAAIRGSTPAAIEIADRTEGKVPQAISPDSAPLEVRIKHVVLGQIGVKHE